jgi:dipeptide/tripeptide permease
VVVYAALGAFGFFRGLYDSNLFASLYEVVRPQSRATATGLMLCAAFLGGGFAPLLIGRMSAVLPLAQALSVTSVLYVAGAILLLADCAVWFRRDAARMRLAMVEHS